MEIQREEHEGDTDIVITFEELAAMLDAAEINLKECGEGVLNNASYFGRIFARSGGVSDAIKQVISEENLNVEIRPVVCNGIDECDKALKIAKFKKINGNFIEGMACKGGCIGGAASLHHGPKDKREVDKYGKLAIETSVRDALRVFDLSKINLDRNTK